MSSAQLGAALSLLAKSGRTFEVRISGTSMGNAIPDGVLVRVEPADVLMPGEVIAFRDGDNRVVAHRLVRIVRDHAIALGDGNRFPDPPIPLDAIVGRVVAFDDGVAWHDVPSAVRRPLPDRWMSGSAVRAAILATKMNVAFARWICRFVIFKKR
jgi:hypothetical protein